MSNIQPEGENMRKAVKWISEERKYGNGMKLSELIEKACLKFDLSPMEAEFLIDFLRQEKA